MFSKVYRKTEEKQLGFSQESRGDKLANGFGTCGHVAIVPELAALISSGPLTCRPDVHKVSVFFS